MTNTTLPPKSNASLVFRIVARVTGVVAGIVAIHRRFLGEHPYKTNAATSGILMGLGDRVAQYVERQRIHDELIEYEKKQQNGEQNLQPKPHLRTPYESYARTSILTIWAGCVSSPWWTWWYTWLHQRFPGKIFMWVLVTAGIPAPFWNCAFFVFSTAAEHAALAPSPWEQRYECMNRIQTKLDHQFLPTVIRSAQLWIPVNILNFYFIPLEFRMLAGSSVAFAWNVYLSLAQMRDTTKGKSANPTENTEKTTSTFTPSFTTIPLSTHIRNFKTIAGFEVMDDIPTEDNRLSDTLETKKKKQKIRFIKIKK